MSLQLRCSVLVAGSLVLASMAFADVHPLPPALSSRAGAAYTLYLDFAGFNYTGTWAGGTPGAVPAYGGATTSFSPDQVATITDTWSRIAESYSPYNINVTTVDPAIAAAQAYSDPARQAYYENTAHMMHTILGGSNAWYNSGAGGVSYVGTTPNSYSGTPASPGNGYHTNWLFADVYGGNAHNMATASAHENGHGLGLWHQGDYNGDTQTAEYSTNNGATGNGSYAPIMGVAYYSQRGLWRLGNANIGGRATQNDAQLIVNDPGMGGQFMQDGNGHTMATASTLPVSGDAVNFNLAKGLIVPTDPVNPNPIGESNYTTDFFKFHSNGGVINLVTHDGGELVTPGVADGDAMLDSTMRIFDSGGNLVATGVRDSSTLFESFNGNLITGDYYVQIASVGGYTPTAFDPTAHYYTMGSYFLTGSGFAAVPEPATFAVLGLGVLALRRRRRR